MIDPSEDGITHVNIYSQGKTELGRFLTNFAFSPIELPEGKFMSIEGYWYWLGTDHPDRDKLKKVVGFNAKKLGREFKATHEVEDPLFMQKICSAIRKKIYSNPKMLKALQENTLPLKHYYVFNGAVREAGFEWIVEFIQSIASGEDQEIQNELADPDG